VTGPDIIFFWVARMIMAGLEFMRPGESLEKRIPFKHVYFTGIIRDQQGRKMSKSLGNSPDPLDLIDSYGADGLRFGIVSIAPQGQDIRFQEDRIEGGKNFCNKLWNACRFRQMSGEAWRQFLALAAILARLSSRRKFDADDHAILQRLAFERRARWTAASPSSNSARRCRHSTAFSGTIFATGMWKFRNRNCHRPIPSRRASRSRTSCCGRRYCCCIRSFPFITEELWHLLGYGAGGQLHRATCRSTTPRRSPTRLRCTGSCWIHAAAAHD
jgi:valyl-tRNA synthetase